jgi:hypothetical protein
LIRFSLALRATIQNRAAQQNTKSGIHLHFRAAMNDFPVALRAAFAPGATPSGIGRPRAHMRTCAGRLA